jgi:hypothetical protein
MTGGIMDLWSWKPRIFKYRLRSRNKFFEHTLVMEKNSAVAEHHPGLMSFLKIGDDGAAGAD